MRALTHGTMGHAQRWVLTILCSGPQAPGDPYPWTPLDAKQAQGAMARLYQRGLVEPVRFDDRGRRVYALSRAGVEFCHRLMIDGHDAEEDEA